MDSIEHKKAIEDEFTQIYNQFRSSIYKFCLVKLNGDNHSAEDCMQNAFMVFYRKLQHKEEILNPRAYLYKTANNFVMKSIEAKAKEYSRTVPIEDYQDEAIDNQVNIDSDIDYQLLNKKLSQVLNKEEQQLLRLKYIDDLTIEQVAQRLEITKPAVAKRLQRLREKIKNSIVIE